MNAIPTPSTPVTKRPIRRSVSAETLMNMAYQKLSGDPLGVQGLHHQGSPTHRGNDGLTKRQVYTAAMAGDIGMFKAMAQRINGHAGRAWMVSRRTMIQVPGRKPRAIDTPSESKRLYAEVLRQRLQEAADIQGYLLPGVVGFRGTSEFPAFRGRKDGITIQDIFASTVQQLVAKHGPFAVSVDLTDAFGQLPLGSIHVPLKELGICHGDRRTIIDVVRIRTTTRAGRLLRPRHAGIEQGNPMSPTIFNLVMSAILGRVEDKSGCHAASYGDDIILVANSQAAAELAFRTFVEVTQDLGFRNVRPLGSVGKASRIFNTDLEPVPLIKTFRVSSRNIGLVDSKLEELRTRIGDRQLSLRQIRRLNKWKVLSKKSIRPLARFWQGGTPETSGSHSLIGEAEIILAGVPADFSSDVGHLSCHGIEAGMGTIDPCADFRTDPLEDVPLYAHGSDSAVVPSPSTGESARHVSETETIVRMSLPGSASTTISSCPIESREVVYEAA